MPNLRITLWVALAAMLYLNYGAWMKDYGAAPETTASAPAAPRPPTQNAPSFADTVPQAAPPPAAAPVVGTATTPTTAAPPETPARTAAPAPAAQRLEVKTDVFDIRINLKGGELDQADLTEYPLHKDQPNIPVRLLNRDSEREAVLDPDGPRRRRRGASCRTISRSGPRRRIPSLCRRARTNCSVPLTWTDGEGLTVTKTFVFTRGSYAIDVRYDIDNKSAAPRTLATYAQILRALGNRQALLFPGRRRIRSWARRSSTARNTAT